jgi:hypothetical protein
VAVKFESTEQSVDSPCGPFRVASQSVTVCHVEQLP